jgi:hypothetical protein
MAMLIRSLRTEQSQRVNEHGQCRRESERNAALPSSEAVRPIQDGAGFPRATCAQRKGRSDWCDRDLPSFHEHCDLGHFLNDGSLFASTRAFHSRE